MKEPYRAFTTWQAWYSGDPERLERAYANMIGYGEQAPQIGVEGSIMPRSRQRWFWGRRLTDPNGNDLADARLHIPLAGDIASTSADLLFAEPPTLSVEGEDGGPDGAGPKPTTERLDMLMTDGGMLPVLIEAAEICAANSGVYLRAGWVDDVADHVLLDAISPECAVPDWLAGRLSAVTFWRILPSDTPGGATWRHLERHESDGKEGRVLHGLYKGTDDALGVLVALNEHPDTERLADTGERAPDADNPELVRQVITGAQRIAVEWIPNMRPPRRLAGTPYGRSDFDGIEATLDAIDEVWSSWMRDIRIGKGRIFLPRDYLRNAGRGQGAMWDAEQAVYTLIDQLPAAEGLAMQAVQFQIRVQEHQQTVTELAVAALRGAGYSTQTFGEAGETAATATEVVARERRSYITRGRKVLYWRAALARQLETALQIDVAHFKPDQVTAVRPQIGFPDGVAQDPLSVAQTISMIHGAEAASLWTRIKLFNPDWEDHQVKDEMERIRADQRNTVTINTPPLPSPGSLVSATDEGTAVPEEEGGPAGSGGSSAGPPPDNTAPAAEQPPQVGRRGPRQPPTFARRVQRRQ